MFVHSPTQLKNLRKLILLLVIFERKKPKSIKHFCQQMVKFRTFYTRIISFFCLEQISRLTAEAIMDLYPEILDPEYDPKKKKQKVDFHPFDFSSISYLLQTTDKTIGELKSYGSLYTTEQLLSRLSKSQIQIVNKSNLKNRNNFLFQNLGRWSNRNQTIKWPNKLE